VQDDFLFMEAILIEKKIILNQKDGIILFKLEGILEQLMWKYQKGFHEAYNNISAFRFDWVRMQFQN